MCERNQESRLRHSVPTSGFDLVLPIGGVMSDKKSFFILLIAGLFLSFGITFCSRTFVKYYFNQSPETKECWLLPSGFKSQGKWQPENPADRKRIGKLIGEGKAEHELEKSILCHTYYSVNDKETNFDVVMEDLWWWRMK